MHIEKYDVIIIGTGIAGTILGTILSRNQMNVLLIDRDQHPKFAIGESTIPQSSAMMKILAIQYDVPELYYLSSFQNIITYVSRNCGMKRNFGFVYHGEDIDYTSKRCYQLGALRDGELKTATEAPTETHFYRQDVDAFMLYLAIHYGCKVYQNTFVNKLDIDNHGVTIETNKGNLIKSKYIIDGTGYSSFIAKHYNTRVSPSHFKTNSRTIYTHMVDVIPYGITIIWRADTNV